MIQAGVAEPRGTEIWDKWTDRVVYRVALQQTSPNRAGVAEIRLIFWDKLQDKNLRQNQRQQFGTDGQKGRWTNRQTRPDIEMFCN